MSFLTLQWADLPLAPMVDICPQEIVIMVDMSPLEKAIMVDMSPLEIAIMVDMCPQEISMKPDSFLALESWVFYRTGLFSKKSTTNGKTI